MKTIYAVTVSQPGAAKPSSTEYHYAEKSAEYRANLLREQAQRNGWNVAVRVIPQVRN